jgi:4a-hydroxytetrahydrobiopterin dehydratase
VTRLTETEIAERLRHLPGWAREGDAIVRQFTFAAFADAVAFVVRLAFEAEAADHHPDLEVSYRRVRVRYSTHRVGGLTDKDFEGAAAADRIAASSARPV